MDGSSDGNRGQRDVSGGAGAKWRRATRVIPPGLGFPARDSRLSGNAGLSLPSSGSSSLLRRVMRFMAMLVCSPAGGRAALLWVPQPCWGLSAFPPGASQLFFPGDHPPYLT